MSETKLDKKAEKAQQSSGKKGGRGTHGSITKAGKVRSQTPKIVKTNLEKHSGPLKKNREKYIRFIKEKEKEKSDRKFTKRDF
jgi:ribosomal protein S30